ncbi:MAG: N-acetyl-gamma-glutamyl-phosphate reductase [Candidatus Omnitrophota bacterium]|jgi:N-acetyl-gamma-glutamyl-phosphate reductase
MINVGIVGISGYSGGLLLEILLKHKDVRITYASAGNTTGPITKIWPRLKGLTKLVCKKFNAQDAADKCDLIFLAVPHTVSISLTPHLLKNGLKVIDLSGDFRLDSATQYKKFYKTDHTEIKLLKKAVYGLSELHREDIKDATLVANPGCYPTAAILALTPAIVQLSKNINTIMIDAKSGVSGAGKKAAVSLLANEVKENFKAYKVLTHQHTPEINLYLGKINKFTPKVNFVPHLLPIKQGILETIYVQLNKKITLKSIHTAYTRFYKTEKFVRVLDLGDQVEIKNVVHTNYCDISLALSEDRTLLVITTVIDNLMKGAASQAVQNMNIMCNFKETEGI